MFCSVTCSPYITQQIYEGLLLTNMSHETFTFRFILLCFVALTRWRHQMETFSALLALCEGNPSVKGAFPHKRPVTWSSDGLGNNRDAGDLRRLFAHCDVTECTLSIRGAMNSCRIFTHILQRCLTGVKTILYIGSGNCLSQTGTKAIYVHELVSQ